MDDTSKHQTTMAPNPTPVYRIVHADNLPTLLKRKGLHSPNSTPDDGLPYRVIHDVDIQTVRRVRSIPCQLGGTMHDFVPFYFGYLSPMLLRLKTGRVQGYTEGQEPLIYLVSTAQAVESAGLSFVFSNGHGVAAFTGWFNRLEHLNEVDWDVVYQRYWSDGPNDFDRQRRKQAEFLVYRFCPWALIHEIAVVCTATKTLVEGAMSGFVDDMKRPVAIRPEWYY